MFILSVFILFFFWIKPAHAAEPVFILHIQSFGQAADDEFIELANESADTVSLGTWSLQYKGTQGKSFSKKNFSSDAVIKGGGTYLIAGKGYVGSREPDMRQSTITLANTGGMVCIVASQVVIASALDPSIVHCLDYAPPAAPDPAPTPSGIVKIQKIEPPRMVLNEFASLPQEGAHEWIELFNPSTYAIELANWSVANGTGKPIIKLEGLLFPGMYKEVSLGAEALGDSGDLLILRDSIGLEVDSISYGDWQNAIENPPAPPEGMALARIGDGVDSNIALADWKLTTERTPGAQNKIVPPTTTQSIAIARTKKSLSKEATAEIARLIREALAGSVPTQSLQPIVIERLEIHYGGAPATSSVKTPTTPKPKAQTKPAAKVPAGTKQIEGVIIVPPGAIWKDMAVVRADDVSYQTTLPKTNRPTLALGDRVRIVGVVDPAGVDGIPRIKPGKNSIQLVGHQDPLEIGEFDGTDVETALGDVVLVRGQVLERKPDALRVGVGALSVMVRGAKVLAMNGDAISARGLFVKIGDEYVLRTFGGGGVEVTSPVAASKKSLFLDVRPYLIAIAPAGIFAGILYVAKRKKKGGEDDGRTDHAIS